jgi:hypothetical protein
MDLYGHLVDANLRQAAQLVGDISGTAEKPGVAIENGDGQRAGTRCLVEAVFQLEPPIGIEPMTYALRVACCLPAHALPAPIARIIALTAPMTLGLSGRPFHEPFHGCGAAD